jgi:hypothetical protein
VAAGYRPRRFGPNFLRIAWHPEPCIGGVDVSPDALRLAAELVGRPVDVIMRGHASYAGCA